MLESQFPVLDQFMSFYTKMALETFFAVNESRVTFRSRMNLEIYKSARVPPEAEANVVRR